MSLFTTTIKLDNSTDWFNLYDLTGLPIGTSLIVTNNTGSILRMIQKETIDPNPTTLSGFPIWPTQTVLVHGNDIMDAMIKGGTDGVIILQPLTSTIMPLTGIEFPQDIVTSGIESFRRLQVDSGQTGFFEGREFRAIRRFELANNEELIFKVDTPIDLIIFRHDLNIVDGRFEWNIWSSDVITEDTVFSTPVPFFNKNNSSNEYRKYNGDRYQSQVTVTTGGSITVNNPDLYIDHLELKTSTVSFLASTVGSTVNSQRYVAPGTYYIQIIGKEADTVGSYAAEWEERPAGVK